MRPGNDFLAISRRALKILISISMTTLLTGCPLKDYFKGSGTVQFMLGPVSNGSCVFLDAEAPEIELGGPVITDATGKASVKGLSKDLDWALVRCVDGTYTDEATGVIKDAVPLRALADLSKPNFTVAVTPLTELAVRIVDHYQLSINDLYPLVKSNLAQAFGLEGVDLVSTLPVDITVQPNTGKSAQRYGAILAVISQLQLDLGVGSTEEVLELLSDSLANNGYFDEQSVRSLLLDALENAHNNDLLSENLGNDDEYHEFHHEIVLAPLVSQVLYVHAEHPDMEVGEAYTKIQANEKSVFEVVGKHLDLRLEITLAGERCRLRDLQHTHGSHVTSELDLLFAECPAQALGSYELMVSDGERIEFSETIDVVDFTAISTFSASFLNTTSMALLDGNSVLRGQVQAESPGVGGGLDGGHSYLTQDLELFNVAGVPVELIDVNENVMATTTTSGTGEYQFHGVPEDIDVAIVVKAQLSMNRSPNSQGPQYNFWVRDNTSSESPRKLYSVKSNYITTASESGSDNELNLTAKIGFNEQGNVISEDMRQSAPFSILRVVKSSVDALVQFDPNVTLPDLNLYWSGKNLAVSGDVKKGQIGTSHYQSSGRTPGVFILGKASDDTDEFDRGVLGHEFGHYLQAQLSFSDSPGGSHGDSEFKDPSITFGEGYGTALGGLLADNNIYCDASGDKQKDSFCIDLNDTVPEGDPNGFYSEATINHLLYAIGKLKGVPAFFASVAELKNNRYSATVFAFLHNYISANPDVANEVNMLMASDNIKTSDPYGALPNGAPSDSAIAASNNKGAAPSGADDLEKIYIPVSIKTVSPPNDGENSPIVTTSSPSFCFNHNLQGAESHNGLGMSRRFSVTSPYTGGLALRLENRLGQEVSIESSTFSVRNESGKDVNVWGYSGADKDEYWGEIDVEQNTKYSVLVNLSEVDIVPKGSDCGYKLVLARPY